MNKALKINKDSSGRSLPKSYYLPKRSEYYSNSIQDFAKSLCKSYKSGDISKESFEKLLEYLLVYFIEDKVEIAFEKKLESLDNRFF